MKPFLVGASLLATFLLSVTAAATELTDLGQGLGYLRAHSLDESIKPLAGATALVLDLRHATATPEAVTSFAAALAARPADARLFVLVSPATPAALAQHLPAPVLTLGIAGSQPAPQVVVSQSAADDRRAYDALATGTPLADLISGTIEKERYDEATLVQEFKLGHPEATPPEPGAPSGGADAPVNARPTDRVLQRAVHLHRALLALKR
ncbi:hypothetical protein Verru16b_01977 [Lacunisphaera limnophila]|uniref:Uncharacterized protein n=1 Tax=Lacunisphaera limnophila TaxID=1838286 RepID=A0A1D8AVH8_9BACT|nr:hypothetical protein [Lacunisphaera limnophila]AOS44908.1 hypothetical protein Verru16b_01977 [Lacunisphaera limnophila]